MVSPYRFIVVNEFELISAEEQEKMLPYFEKPSARTILVLCATALDKRTTFAKHLGESVCVVDLAELKAFALKNWAEDYIRRQGKKISGAALERLMDLAGADMVSLANEVEKLLIYIGEEKEISASAIEQLVPSTRQHELYELTDAIGKKDRRNAIRLMANILDSGEPALRVLATLARHFRQLLIVKELLESGADQRTLMAAAQIPFPRALEGLIKAARSVDLMDLRQLCLKTAEADRRLKSSGVDQKLILESLVHAL
jgi:DNA polymerase-3 subunit delta